MIFFKEKRKVCSSGFANPISLLQHTWNPGHHDIYCVYILMCALQEDSYIHIYCRGLRAMQPPLVAYTFTRVRYSIFRASLQIIKNVNQVRLAYIVMTLPWLHHCAPSIITKMFTHNFKYKINVLGTLFEPTRIFQALKMKRLSA